ncbi:MAG: mechanosensitive ion channel family protein [Bacilli bacterium]
MEFFRTIGNWLSSSGWSFLFTIILLIVSFFVIKLITFILRKILYATKIDNAVVVFYSSLCSVILWIVVILLVASILGIDTSYFIVALSGAAVAIGLALKDSLGNLASGILIIYNKPFKRGDWVNIDNVEGTVLNIKLLTTELITADNRKVVIPNNTISTNSVINYTGLSTRRLDMTYSLSYENDIELVYKAFKEVASKDKRVLKEPSFMIKLQKTNSNNMEFAFRVWVKTKDYWDVYWDMPKQVFDTFKKYNIKMSFSTYELDIKNNKNEN